MEVELTIREMARATGVGEATLRAWEHRYGFPAPRREPSGHRRYSTADVERVGQVRSDRERGLALPAAIERARTRLPGVPSVFARLRAGRPDLQPASVRKRHLLDLTRAVEDESCARAERPLLIGSFQRERFYRQSETRWRDLARSAALAFVIADFARLRRPRGAPVELPVERSHPLAREWVVISHAPDHGACLAAWEPPGRHAVADGDREFELLLSVDPEAVRAAADAAAEVLATRHPQFAEQLREHLRDAPVAATVTQLRLAAGITARFLERLT
jgi:DICT domain-containing protein